MTDSQNKLLALRDQIDAVDKELLEVLNRRASLANAVGDLKREEGSIVYRPEREAEVIAGLIGRNPGPLRRENISHIWREIMSACRSLEAPHRVAVLGPSGTFSEQAALDFFGASVDLIWCDSFDEVFHAASAGTADYGIVAVENSTEGVVTRSLDLFLQSPLQVVGEISLKVEHDLLRLEPNLDGIEAVAAHPQALAQCHDWLAKHLPNAEQLAVSSNAEGARLASENARYAALGSARAASVHGLHRAMHAVQDEAHNRTRFCVLCLPSALPAPQPTGNDCTSLIVSVPNRAGAVYDLLLPLKQNGVSMTRFESRPARNGQWEYYFYIDLAGHAQDKNVHQALTELQRICGFYKVIGSYPASA